MKNKHTTIVNWININVKKPPVDFCLTEKEGNGLVYSEYCMGIMYYEAGEPEIIYGWFVLNLDNLPDGLDWREDGNENFVTLPQCHDEYYYVEWWCPEDEIVSILPRPTRALDISNNRIDRYSLSQLRGAYGKGYYDGLKDGRKC